MICSFESLYFFDEGIIASYKPLKGLFIIHHKNINSSSIEKCFLKSLLKSSFNCKRQQKTNLDSNQIFMGFDQYHEPADELSQEVRTFARMIKSLIEEAEAIDWYEQRVSVEKDDDAKKIMQNAQKEEFIHFAMDLEFLLRKKKKWRIIMKNVLFKEGDIVENGEKAEDEVEGK
jgi:hypothetical protein